MEKTNALVQTTYVEQTANEMLGTKSKKLYFLLIETPTGKMQINVGEKTYNEVMKLTAPRDEKTVVNVLPKDDGGNLRAGAPITEKQQIEAQHGKK